MENIHTIDSDIIETLVNMFNSDDEDNIRLGLTILNNADFNDNKIMKYINELYHKCSGLFFSLFQNKKGDSCARFCYITYDKKTNEVDESILDEDEWEPSEAYKDWVVKN